MTAPRRPSAGRGGPGGEGGRERRGGERRGNVRGRKRGRKKRKKREKKRERRRGTRKREEEQEEEAMGEEGGCRTAQGCVGAGWTTLAWEKGEREARKGKGSEREEDYNSIGPRSFVVPCPSQLPLCV
eukprot:2953273-Rhodomonas_salina.1